MSYYDEAPPPLEDDMDEPMEWFWNGYNFTTLKSKKNEKGIKNEVK